LSAQEFPERRITKEVGDADQQFPEEQVKLLRVFTQVERVTGNPVNLQQRRAPFNAPIEGAGFVQREIIAAAVAQQRNDAFQRTVRAAFREQIERHVAWLQLKITDDAGRQLFRRGDDIDNAGFDRAVRHAVGLGRCRGLNGGETGFFLDGTQPEHAVRAHAGKNDPNGFFTLRVGQRAKEEINRQA
jgi:hypothetical protein